MEAKEAMVRYPALMEHHIRDAIPCELKRVRALHCIHSIPFQTRVSVSVYALP
jgi:hypothetical protein